MRTFISGATKFYFMDPYEKLPDVYQDRSFVGAYVIWPRNTGKWDVRWKYSGDWEEIAGNQFDTENAAFLCAHAHHVKRS
ncbi:hypothetical protein [Pantoea agglomerans]|uniref:hypothetical protein n=1 Tax=Enterobacter agglomerans TaxID=549 RepID=UPI003C7BC605